MDSKCTACGKGTMKRDHTCEDYVIWVCDNMDPALTSKHQPPGCNNQELEHFSDLDRDGWRWLMSYYKKEAKNETAKEDTGIHL